MKLHNFLGAFVLVLSFAVGASAQEGSEVSGGGGGITAAPGSGTTGRVPQFASSSSLADSKMLTSGTNSGTWTLYDDTAVVGVSQFVVRPGAGQGSTPEIRFGSQGLNEGVSFFVSGSGSLQIMTGDRTQTKNVEFGRYTAPNNEFWISGNPGEDAFQFGSTVVLKWGDTSTYNSAKTVGLAWAASGILKVTDGSTGQGGIGISDAATNTVTDALILRHATSGTAAASFGTGLLFQGEDAAGNMQDMAQIQAVYTVATDTSEEADVKFYTVKGGASELAMTLDANFFGVGAKALVFPGDAYLWASGTTLFIGGGAVEWGVTSTALNPVTSDQNTLGSSSLLLKSAYVSTSIQGTRTQAITDNAAAATFVTIAVPTSNTTVGGRIFYTITAIDAGTAIQTKTGTYSFGLNNIGGTVTGSGTDVLEHSQISSGTLAPTFSVNISGTNAQFQLVLDTSLDAAAETLKIEYRVQIDSGTATVTPAT